LQFHIHLFSLPLFFLLSILRFLLNFLFLSFFFLSAASSLLVQEYYEISTPLFFCRFYIFQPIMCRYYTTNRQLLLFLHLIFRCYIVFKSPCSLIHLSKKLFKYGPGQIVQNSNPESWWAPLPLLILFFTRTVRVTIALENVV